MKMKNLTHYFKSPKDDETDKCRKPESPEIFEEKAPPKKRKISLSKKKLKKNECTDDEKLSRDNIHNDCEAQDSKEKCSPGKNASLKNRKRKVEDDLSSSCKKPKKVKPLVKSSQKNDTQKIKSNSKGNSQITQSKSMKKPAETNPTDEVHLANEDSLSCDEPLVKTNRRIKQDLFVDSDDENPKPVLQSQPLAEEVKSGEKSCNLTSRNSLFSYFNKVNKETALKQQKSEKIEVKAIVHSSPNGVIVERKSLDRKNLAKKAKKQKNKSQLDDSDTIEVISTEEIIDENSSTTVNVLLETENNHKSPSHKEERVVNNSKPQLASIFLPKKISQDTKTEISSSLSLVKKEIPIKQDEEIQCQVQKDSSKKKARSKALSQSKKCLKTSKSKANEKCLGDQVSTEDNSCNEIISHEDQRPITSVGLISQTDLDDKNKHSNVKKTSDKKKLVVEGSPKTVMSSKNLKSSNGKTPEKLSTVKSKSSNDEELTPKQKGSYIKGYFTPTRNTVKSDNNSAKKCAKSPWVMKVCLNSALKSQSAETDEAFCQDDSQDSVKKEESLTNSPEELAENLRDNEVTTPVVVIEDDSTSSPEGKTDDGKRKYLSRNAKKIRKTLLEEEVEETIELKPQPSKPPVKICPIFQKGGARQSKEPPVDEAKLKAKMLFLESGVPEIIKRKVETVRSEAVLGSPAPFPTVSHVVQADDESSLGHDSASLHLPPARGVSPPPVLPDWTSPLPMDPSEESDIPVFERPGNVKAFLEKLKEEEPKTEVKVLFKKLKEYKSKAESDIWTEVYKPTHSADMVGNSENIKKLKTWLETLKNCRRREGSVSSGDEFVTEDSDGDESSFNNMAVICGPCGCGKTSAVYAIAKELDIKVLEINASCNRSGKRILAEFSESTQSHHVERSQPLNGFFGNQGSGKKKRKKSKLAEKSKSEKTSLILVEDADLLFTDCDEGFVPALASLAASSKRPIVLVTNHPTTPHLDRFNNTKLLQLTFNRPKPNKLVLWLRLVGLVEGVIMPYDLALRLVTASNCDVRKCLLQLQLMVHSNNSEVKDKQNVSRLWWGWPSSSRHGLSYELPTLLEPEEAEGPTAEVDRRQVLRQLQAAADITRRLAILDVMALSDQTECLEDHENPCPLRWVAKWRDSTSLEVPSTPDPCLDSEASWLQQTLSSNLGPSPRTGQTPQEARWLSILRQGEQMFLSGIATTVHTGHQSVTCDYLPTLRELGRSEQVRMANYTRRANRFFNYLQGLGIHASKSYRDFMCDCFSCLDTV